MYYTKLEGPALAAYTKMVEELKKRAILQIRLSCEQIVVRELRPEDVGLTTPAWTFNISSTLTWNTMANTTIADQRFVGINGVFSGETGRMVVTQLKINRAGEIKRYWPIQDINMFEDSQIFFDDPIIIDQNTNLTIKGYNSTGTIDPDFRLSFIGAVAEKSGLLVR